MKIIKSKKAIAKDYLGWIIIGVIALVIFIGAYLVLKGKLFSGLDYIRNFLRFGNLFKVLDFI